MKTKTLLAGLLLVSHLASAQNIETTSAADFVAPSVSSETHLPGLVTGQIYYDLTAGAFRGINKNGTYDTLSALGNPVSSDTANERIERLQITTVCTSSPCTIASQSGGVSSVVRNGTGNYTINFISGKFAAAPTCVMVSLGTTNTFCAGSGSSASTFVFDCRRTSTEANVDTGASIICMGPRVL